jgi:hypothetical protein
MSSANTVINLNGEILTGKLWRKDLSFFNTLPFYTNIPMLDNITGPLEKVFGDVSQEGGSGALLVVR